MENPNTNCLEGMRCPACGSFGPFKIATIILVTVYDTGTEDEIGDHEWDGDSTCICDHCDHSGTVAEFTEPEPEPEPEPEKKYTVSYTFVANDDREASDLYIGGHYLEADPEFSWTLLPEEPKPEPEANEDKMPEEGDWITSDRITFAQFKYPKAWVNRVVVAEGEDWREVLKKRMEADHFWPDVWFISDHGNCYPLLPWKEHA